VATTRSERHIDAPRQRVYEALTDGEAVARWRVPDDMTAEVHVFEPRPGGAFRVSVTYADPTRAGKTAGPTDTYQGHFASLVRGERVVEVLAFETDDPDYSGQMTITTTLADADGGGTDVLVEHEGIPAGVWPEDNETGTQMGLAKLASLVEGSA
jgi:uncharacterized protein YndB with AHSA1/START domain